jgi:hypothetical protein
MANPKDIYLPDHVELIDYLPEFVGLFKEMQVLQGSLTREVNDMVGSFYQSFYNAFVNYTDDDGILMFEKMFGIVAESENIDDRRMAVLALINKALPYSYNGFVAMLDGLCGNGNYEIEMNYGEYTLTIRIGIAARAQYDTVNELIKQIVPANILCDLKILYNKYKTVGRLTYEQCAKKTFYELRNSLLVEN